MWVALGETRDSLILFAAVLAAALAVHAYHGERGTLSPTHEAMWDTHSPSHPPHPLLCSTFYICSNSCILAGQSREDPPFSLFPALSPSAPAAAPGSFRVADPE